MHVVAVRYELRLTHTLPRGPHRPSTSDHLHPRFAGAGASAKERASAGTNQDPASVPEDAPGLAGKTNGSRAEGAG